MVRENKNPQIEAAFTYHRPHGDQPERYGKLRDAFKELAYEIVENCPNSRERSLALTHLEDANMWANASIARSEVEA